MRQSWNRLPLKWQILVASLSLSLLGIAVVSLATSRNLHVAIEEAAQADLDHALGEIDQVLQARTANLTTDLGNLAASTLVMTALQDTSERMPYLDELFENLIRAKPFVVGLSLHDFWGRQIAGTGLPATEARLNVARRITEAGSQSILWVPDGSGLLGFAAPVLQPSVGSREGAIVMLVDASRYFGEALPPLLPGLAVTLQVSGRELFRSAELPDGRLRAGRDIQFNAGAGWPGPVALRAEVSLPSDRLTQPMRRLVQSALTAALFAIFVATVFALWVSQRLSRPLESIAARLDLIAARPQDPQSLPAFESGTAETLRLASAFGRMIDSVNDYRTRLESLVLERTDALAQAESRLAGIVRTLDDAVYSYYVETGEIVYMSPSTERIFGVDISASARDVDMVSTHCLPQDRYVLIGKLGHLRRSREPIEVRYRIRRPDGEIRWIRDTARSTLVASDGGVALRADGTLSDLTALVAAEVARDDALERLHVLQRALVSARNGVMVADARASGFPLVFVNPSFERITGYSAAEAIGRNCAYLSAGQSEQAPLALLRAALRDRRDCRVVLRNFRKDGSPFWNELSVSPVMDESGQVTHFVGVIEDITAAVEREARLRDTTERLDAVFALSPDAVACFDPSGRLSAHNPALARMLGVTEEVLRDATRDQFECVLRARLDPSCVPADATASLFEGVERRELLLQKPTRYLRASIARSAADSGGVRIILYLRDVTHEVEVNRMKSEFLSTAAHELRTPLASVRGYAELLLHRQFPEPVQAEMLGTIARQAVRLSDLVNELLDLARIEARAGKDFRFETGALQDVVEAVVDELPIGDAARVRIEADDEVPAVLLDLRKMHQAIHNLVANALKYSQTQEQLVRVSVRCRLHPELGRAPSVSVIDRGIGMKPEHLARAFERFFRADPTGATSGTGLGLPLVREIVEIHGGRVELGSEFGVGTEAIVWLPVAMQGVGPSEGIEPLAPSEAPSEAQVADIDAPASPLARG